MLGRRAGKGSGNRHEAGGVVGLRRQKIRLVGLGSHPHRRRRQQANPRDWGVKGVAARAPAVLRPSFMDTDRNLLFGVLALQADLIDPRQFLEACLLWTSRKNVALPELLVERGWIVPADREHLDYLLGRKLQKHGGDPKASLAALPDDIKCSLAALDDDDIRRSLAGPPRPESASQVATLGFVPCPRERY